LGNISNYQPLIAAGTYLTTLPSTANFSTLTISNNAVATQTWVTSQNYQPLITAGTYLTNLPSTANFTTLTVSNNAVATQSWVTSQAYLTTLPSTANFTTLTKSNNAVATQTYVDTSVSTSAQQLTNAIGLSLTNKSVSANFLS